MNRRIRYLNLISACTTVDECLALLELLSVAREGADVLPPPDRNRLCADICAAAYHLGLTTATLPERRGRS